VTHAHARTHTHTHANGGGGGGQEEKRVSHRHSTNKLPLPLRLSFPAKSKLRGRRGEEEEYALVLRANRARACNSYMSKHMHVASARCAYKNNAANCVVAYVASSGVNHLLSLPPSFPPSYQVRSLVEHSSPSIIGIIKSEITMLYNFCCILRRPCSATTGLHQYTKLFTIRQIYFMQNML
jgi:hypothetical protein